MNKFAIALFLFLSGCAQAPHESEIVYLVSGHDTPTGRWTLERINNADHIRVKYVLECQFYHWASKEPVKGSDACDLLVGDKLVPNPLPDKPGDFLDIFLIGGDTLVISKGPESDRVSEHFSVKSAQLVAYRSGA